MTIVRCFFNLGITVFVLSVAALQAQQAAEPDPGDLRRQVRGLLRAATSEFDAGRVDAVKTICDSILAIDPANPDAPLYLARIAVGQDDSALAIQTLQKTVAEGRRSFRVKKYLARLHLGRNEVESAMKLVDEILMIRSGDGEALYLKGLALLSSGDSVAAIDVLEQALRVAEAKDKK